jgi:hypothetical protein
MPCWSVTCRVWAQSSVLLPCKVALLVLPSPTDLLPGSPMKPHRALQVGLTVPMSQPPTWQVKPLRFSPHIPWLWRRKYPLAMGYNPEQGPEHFDEEQALPGCRS